MRPRRAPAAVAAGSYFVGDKSGLQFVSSGCAIMDAALGGGYVLGRVANIVGDRSAGKTLCAMEIVANFHNTYPTGHSRYAESEAAFDIAYAGALGIPIDKIEFNTAGVPLGTIEDLHKDMLRVLDENTGRPKLYVIDSLDALSDDAEIERDFNKDDMGGKKPKLIGQLFRRLIQRIEDEDMLLVVVSQLRENMTAMAFQEKYKRSGGKALDFYASHIVWLNEIGKLKKKVGGLERIVGVDVKARVRKNKVGLPFRECKYPILFGYGIDDLTACAEWLLENNRETVLRDELGMSKSGHATLIANVRNKGGADAIELRRKMTAVVAREWAAIETTFLPQSRKY